MQPTSYKRIGAYLLDIIIVSLVSTLLTLNVINSKQYKDMSEKYTNLIREYSEKGIEESEFKKQSYDLVYDMNKQTVVVTVVTIVLTTVYFVVVPFFMNGQTLGKKLMKLQVISNNKKKITMNNFLLRALFMNSILMNILGVLFVLFMPKKIYFTANDILTYIFGAFYIVSISMILFREDRRGLHDIIANTRVISTERPKEIIPDKEEVVDDKKIKKIKEASIIEKNV